MKDGQDFFYARVAAGSSEVEEEIKDSFSSMLSCDWIPSREIAAPFAGGEDVIMVPEEKKLDS